MSKIEWTEKTWNPVTGCTKISAGCKNCYAETFAERWRGTKGHPYEQGFDLKLWPERLQIPLRRKKPTMYFVNSMSDLFHEDIPDEFIAQVFDVMHQTPRHTYQILTKRPQIMFDFIKNMQQSEGWGMIPSHIWLGVSVENQMESLKRIGFLLGIAADRKFVSLEPLLEPVRILNDWVKMLDWAIVGGESGPGCRPMEIEWARYLRDQCKKAGTAFFMKQLGGHPYKRDKMEDFPEDLRIREYPK